MRTQPRLAPVPGPVGRVRARGAPVAGRPPAPPGETWAVRAALALVVLAILDDAFWHREPGTAAGDHVVAAAIPVAVAVAFAVFYPRLRGLVRGFGALCCGILAATAGAGVSLRHVLIDRLAGDDVTGLLAGLGGVALIVLGVVTLWRTRRRDGSLPWRWARRGVIAVAAVLAGFLVVLPAGVAIIATHRARSPVSVPDLGRPAEAVRLRTGDGLTLAGSYVPSRNGAAIVVFPGRSGTAAHARMLVDGGYGVLVLDRRGEGASEGDFQAYGWGGEPDVRAAVAYLRGRPDVERGRVGGLGLSVGGELMLQTAAHDRGLRAVVADGAGVRTLAEHLQTPGLGLLQRWIAPWPFQQLALAVLSTAPAPQALTDLVPRIAPHPVLFIRAEHGAGGEELTPVYHRAAGEPKALWIVAGAGHTDGLRARPREYARRVVRFFDRALHVSADR